MIERFVDLSHTITDGMSTYKGLPTPLICDYLSREASQAMYEPGIEFQAGNLEGFSFSAVPPKIQSVGTFPVRAFTWLG